METSPEFGRGLTSKKTELLWGLPEKKHGIEGIIMALKGSPGDTMGPTLLTLLKKNILHPMGALSCVLTLKTKIVLHVICIIVFQ